MQHPSSQHAHPHKHMWKHIHRGNSEVQTGLSLSKLQLFTHKAYCAVMYFSLWLPENDMVSVEVSNSMFHHHCLLLSHDYSKQIYTNCVILCFKCYVLWEKPKKNYWMCYYWTLLPLLKSPESWHHYVSCNWVWQIETESRAVPLI